MEVRGSVFLGDVDDEHPVQVKGGFADLKNELQPHEKDTVPRILVKGFRRNTKPLQFHSIFSNFGTITYLAVKGQRAVLEFTSKAAIEEIMRCKFLKVGASQVHIEILQKFLHVEKDQFSIELHEDLKSLDSKTAFDTYLSNLCLLSNEERNPNLEKYLCKTIEKAARRRYPHCIVYTFGSRTTNLALNRCDLDIFLDSGNMYTGECGQSPREQQLLGEDVLREIIRCDDFARVHKVLNARVPILKFFHSPSGTYGDIAFLHGLGVENSKLLVFLQSLDTRLRPFFLFVKMWSHLQGIRRVSEQCHFTSYSLIMMAVFYLQQLPQPVLPSIRMLMDLHQGDQLIVAGWPCSFVKDKKSVPQTENNTPLLALTKGFFQFYQSFHFEWKIICPFLGKAIEKSELEKINSPDGELAELFPQYIDNLQNKSGEPFRTHVALCVQDPFEHSHNLTRCVKSEVLMNFVSSCGLMYEQFCTFT